MVQRGIVANIGDHFRGQTAYPFSAAAAPRWRLEYTAHQARWGARRLQGIGVVTAARAECFHPARSPADRMRVPHSDPIYQTHQFPNSSHAGHHSRVLRRRSPAVSLTTARAWPSRGFKRSSRSRREAIGRTVAPE